MIIQGSDKAASDNIHAGSHGVSV